MASALGFSESRSYRMRSCAPCWSRTISSSPSWAIMHLPTKGFFISKTSLMDPNLPETDPRKYVDAATVPYVVFPGAFHAIVGTGTWGDVVMARALGAADKHSAAIVADGGPTKAPLGEISLKLAEAF